ncbi:DAK2 domain-containing protein [Clostridium sp. DL1XJH146]
MNIKINNEKLYYAYLSGAKEVMINKNDLNKINVFPVADGDTGSNLYSTMNSIIKDSKLGQSIKHTVESIADAALGGARGNSGIIFAQYLQGISDEIENENHLTMDNFIKANKNAVNYAYNAIANPVEGTMVTVIKAWSEALNKFKQNNFDMIEVLNHSYKQLEEAVKNTPNQLNVLKKASVVDSGAKGFTIFIKGFIDFLKSDNEKLDFYEDNIEEEDLIVDVKEHTHNHEEITFRYCTEALIEGENIDVSKIKKLLSDVGDSLVVAGSSKKVRVHIHTDKPYEVFEIMDKIGKIIYQKADDMKKQKDIVENRKNDIAILTDSIADLPQEFIDENQIHVINLNIIMQDINYFDKLTITNKKILEYANNNEKLPTTSQPDFKSVENIFQYLSTYYKSIIVLTVSKELSGTYSIISNVAKKFNDENKDKKISVIDSKQNSGAEGLLVMELVDEINKKKSHNDIVQAIEEKVAKTKILVNVKKIDNMIKSGRLSINAGKVAKFINMKPIITLDNDGRGALESIAFSNKGSLNKTVKSIKRVLKENKIKEYSIVHVNNEEEANIWANIFEKIIGKKPNYIDKTSSIIAIGAGDGAVAISYITE